MTPMTKRHFELLAATLHMHVQPHVWPYHYGVVVSALADALATTNPRFDRERFVEWATYGKAAKRPRKRTETAQRATNGL